MTRVLKQVNGVAGAVEPRKKPRAVARSAAPRVKKVSVSLAADDLAWASKEARARKLSLSAVLSDALHRRRRAQALQALLGKLGSEQIPEAELAKLRAELYGAG